MAMMKSIHPLDVCGMGGEPASGWGRLVAGLRALFPVRVQAPAVPVAGVDAAEAR